jgi:hypothetical protein
MDFSVVVIVVLGGVFAVIAVRGLDLREQRNALVAASLHVLGAFAHWAIGEFYYVLSDTHGYHDFGFQLAKLLDFNFTRFAPEILNLLLHREANLPFDPYGPGSGATMGAFAAILIFLQGPSLLAMDITTSFFSWFGQLCFYRVARQELEEGDRMAGLIGCFYVPSVIFWGAGFSKEAIVLGFFGILALSTYRLLRNRSLPSLVGVVVGGVGVAMLKPFTLFAYVLALAAFIYADRAWREGAPIRIRPAYLVLAGAIAVGGIVAMGSLFPEYAPDNIAESFADRQEAWTQGEGGSTIELGSGKARTPIQQLQFAPIALVTALFRPSLVEARNGPTFLAAIETTLLVLGVLSLLGIEGRATVRRVFFRVPLLVFSGVFVLVFAIAVGLATSNLGSLSRYRMPMMPFYATMLLLLRERMREARAGKEELARSLVPARRSRVA